jgi:allantoicase
MSTTNSAPDFTKMIDLAAEKLGGKAIMCTDEFFAEMDNLLKPGRGIFIADKFTERGKWMDGWESRRKRTQGHDWCIIELAASGKIHGVDIDTNFFLGNHPPHSSMEACNISTKGTTDFEHVVWDEILPKSPLNPGSQNFFEIKSKKIYTHIKLHIYPDGGVARLKVYGEVCKEWDKVSNREEIDLASAVNGAKSIACNDMFFSHMDNLLMPDKGINMGDGWETKRNRTPNNKDWVIVRLAHAGIIKKALIDTAYFIGNYPDSFTLEGCNIPLENEGTLTGNNINWIPILPQIKLKAGEEHFFEAEIIAHEKITHVRLTIFPDGGISRMRLFGTIVA